MSHISAEIAVAGLVAPRIEPEIVPGFAADVAADASDHEVSAAVGWVAAGFEVVECHYPAWDMTPADAIADAGLHAALVVGEPVALDGRDGRLLADIEVQVMRDEEEVARGRGAAALGGPVDAVVWLLRVPGVSGVRAGAMVTTGTLTAALPVGRGERWTLRASGPLSLPAADTQRHCRLRTAATPDRPRQRSRVGGHRTGVR